GLSESTTRQGKLFSVLDDKNGLFRRRDASIASASDRHTLPRPRDEASATAQPQRVHPVEHDLEQKVRRAMSPYSPAEMVIDRRHTVQRFSGGSAGAYLEPSDGAASFNLFTLLKKALRSAAREIISRAMANDQTVTRDDL